MMSLIQKVGDTVRHYVFLSSKIVTAKLFRRYLPNFAERQRSASTRRELCSMGEVCHLRLSRIVFGPTVV